MDLANTPRLETERLQLRKFNEKDVEALLALHRAEEVNIYLPWFPLKTLEEARAFFEKNYTVAYEQPRAYQYAICFKAEETPIGSINVSMEDAHDLGYGLRREFWHKGIVTEAGKAVLSQVKKDGLPYVTATHDVKNARSGGVMKQLGMRYQYSYEEQWQPKNKLVTFRMYQINLNGQTDQVYQKYWNEATVHFVESNL